MQTSTHQNDPREENEHIEDASCDESPMEGEGDVDSLRAILEGLDSNDNNYNPNGTNIMYTVFLIVNATLGGALLNFPKSFDDGGGIIAGIIVQLILLVFVMIALLALIYAADQCGPGGAATIQVSKHDNN